MKHIGAISSVISAVPASIYIVKETSGLSPQMLPILGFVIFIVLCIGWLGFCLFSNWAGVFSGGAYLSDIMLKTFVIERRSLPPNIDIGSLLKLDIISNHNEKPKILEDFVRLAFWLKFKGRVARCILILLTCVAIIIVLVDSLLKPGTVDLDFNIYFLLLFVIATVINFIQAYILKDKIRRILPIIRDNSKDNKSKLLDQPDWFLSLSAW